MKMSVIAVRCTVVMLLGFPFPAAGHGALLLAQVQAPVAAEDGPPYQLLPMTIAYLVELGIDPNSPEVRTAAIDKINGEDLNTLAADRARRDVPRFIATRNFIRALRLNTKAEFPKGGLYQSDYLTEEEKAFVADVVVRRLQGIGGR